MFHMQERQHLLTWLFKTTIRNAVRLFSCCLVAMTTERSHRLIMGKLLNSIFSLTLVLLNE